jgi:hypothetical protein
MATSGLTNADILDGKTADLQRLTTNTINCTTLAAKRQLHDRYTLLMYLLIYALMTPKVVQHTL